MKEFCDAVLQFLNSEYQDSYSFSIECRHNILTSYHVELTVKYNTQYSMKIDDSMMAWLFRLYKEAEYIEEREQFVWQKELVDLIEGS